MGCIHCGKESHEEFAFCPYCGKELPKKEVVIEETIEEVKEEVKIEPVVTESIKEEIKEEKPKTNFKALGLIVAFVFSILAIVFAFQINNQLKSFEREIKHLNNRMEISEFLSYKQAREHAEQVKEKTKPPVAEEKSGLSNGKLLFSQISISDNNGEVHGVFKVNTTPELLYNGLSLNDLDQETAVEFTKDIIDNIWHTNVSPEGYESIPSLNIELYVNDQLYATFDGDSVTLN